MTKNGINVTGSEKILKIFFHKEKPEAELPNRFWFSIYNIFQSQHEIYFSNTYSIFS